MIQKFVKVAKVHEIPPGQVKLVEVGNRSIALCNVFGKIYAISNVCTHDGGDLAGGELMGNIIECPRHGAQFNVKTGAVVAPPAVVPVDTYEVRIQGTDIEIAVS